jgi:hypothetical protein
MDTKLKGDVAEQAAILQALRRGWGVLSVIGDRLPYDLVFDVSGVLVKVQVKCAWFYGPVSSYMTDNRRTKTNRRSMVRAPYAVSDFDFALVYVEQGDLFYVFPVDVFIGYASQIYLVESDKRQRKPRSAEYRDAWELISNWAARGETCVRNLSKSGKPPAVVIPSQAPASKPEKV